MLPNYLIIGTGRSATTWIHDCLSDHPEVYTPEIKELHFFSTHFDKGLDFYHDYFKVSAGKKYKAIGEASPTYLSDQKSAERIAKYLPEIKLIAILRNPIHRAFSQYLAFIKDHDESTFEEAIKKRPSLLTDGQYYDHLMRYKNLFPEDQLLILLYDDIKQDQLKFIQQIFNFLNIDESFIPPSLQKPSNMAVNPAIRRMIDRLKLDWLIEIVKKSPLDSVLRKMAQRKKGISYPKIGENTREELKEYFKTPNEKLSILIDRDLSSWV